FFDLGGHSLLATQVIAQMRQTFQVELPLQSFFETPTVAGQARAVETAIRGGQDDLEKIMRARRFILPRSRDMNAVLLSFAQERLWFLDQLEPGNPAYNIPATVRLQGQIETAVLEQCLDALVQRHEALRTTVVLADGQPVQRVGPVEAQHAAPLPT